MADAPLLRTDVPASEDVPAHTVVHAALPSGKQRVSNEAAIPALDGGPAGLGISSNDPEPFGPKALDYDAQTEGYHFVIITVPLTADQRASILTTIENGVNEDGIFDGLINTAIGYFDRPLPPDALAAAGATAAPFTPAVREHMVRLAQDACRGKGPCPERSFLAFVDPASLTDGKATLLEIASDMPDDEQPEGQVEVAVRVPLTLIKGYFLQSVSTVTLAGALPRLEPGEPVDRLPPLPIPSFLDPASEA